MNKCTHRRTVVIQILAIVKAHFIVYIFLRSNQVLLLLMTMMMMWGATLILMSFVAAQVTSQEIKVQCHEFNDLPPSSEPSPSELANLTVMLVKVRGEDMLNISWAVNIDGSHEYLTGIRIVISGQTPYHCEYHPAFAEPYLRGSEQVSWIES